MVFTSLSDYIRRYKDTSVRESTLSYGEWVYDNELVEDGEILAKDLDYFKLIIDNIIDKNSYFLDQYVYTVQLTDEQYRKYRCNAHRLAYDIFGTTALWFLITNLNEMYSEAEFDTSKFKMYRPDIMRRISEIKIVENDQLERNKAELSRMENALKLFYTNQDEDDDTMD